MKYIRVNREINRGWRGEMRRDAERRGKQRCQESFVKTVKKADIKQMRQMPTA